MNWHKNEECLQPATFSYEKCDKKQNKKYSIRAIKLGISAFLIGLDNYKN
jgi:hypothetical protein